MDIGAYDGGLRPPITRASMPQSPARKQLEADFAASVAFSIPSSPSAATDFPPERDLPHGRYATLISAGRSAKVGCRTKVHLSCLSGIGHFGKVYLARTKAPADSFILVLKCLSKDEMVAQNVQNQVRREIDVSHLPQTERGRALADGPRLCSSCGESASMRYMLLKLNTARHPNIIRLYGWFHDAHRIFLMLELAGHGELYKHLRKAGRFSEPRSSKVCVLAHKPGSRADGAVRTGDGGRPGLLAFETYHPSRYQAGESAAR